ncbi:MAG: hypothetical protein ACRD0C_07020 [Acidimicrobiia bacterium]
MDILATSRTLSLRPSEAKAAMQRCVESVVRLNLPAGARAVLHAAPLRGASATERSLLVGTVRSPRGWVSVPVEIETAPVSATDSELVVRPVGPVCLRSTSHRRLFERTSHVLADFFRMEIELAALAAAAPATVRTAPASVPLPASFAV